MCHQPGGITQANIDFRWTTPLSDMGLVDEFPLGHDFGLEQPRIISSESEDQSVLINRMQDTGQYRMPPLGTSVVDQETVDMLLDWFRADLSLSGSDGWDEYQ